MTLEGLDAGAATNVPELASLIDGSCQAILASEVELTAGQLTLVALQSMNALSSHDIPNFGSVIERCGHDLITLGVEIQ